MARSGGRAYGFAWRILVKGSGELAFLDVLRARIENFFHAVQLAAPQVARLIETSVDVIEAGVGAAASIIGRIQSGFILHS